MPATSGTSRYGRDLLLHRLWRRKRTTQNDQARLVGYQGTETVTPQYLDGFGGAKSRAVAAVLTAGPSKSRVESRRPGRQTEILPAQKEQRFGNDYYSKANPSGGNSDNLKQFVFVVLVIVEYLCCCCEWSSGCNGEGSSVGCGRCRRPGVSLLRKQRRRRSPEATLEAYRR
jgi:hypothetical protein